jgi:ribosomal protein S12 methylthiotransferase accessory factor YcaO
VFDIESSFNATIHSPTPTNAVIRALLEITASRVQVDTITDTEIQNVTISNRSELKSIENGKKKNNEKSNPIVPDEV